MTERAPKVTVECEHGVILVHHAPQYGSGIVLRGEMAVKLPIRVPICNQCTAADTPGLSKV